MSSNTMLNKVFSFTLIVLNGISYQAWATPSTPSEEGADVGSQSVTSQMTFVVSAMVELPIVGTSFSGAATALVASAGTMGTVNLRAWLKGTPQQRQVLKAIAADAADYLATEGARESSLLFSVKQALRSYANHVPNLDLNQELTQELTDEELVLIILASMQSEN